MASIACTSTRHLSRLFDEHVGLRPLDFVRSLRLELASKALQSGHSVRKAAELAGFSSDLQLRRAWKAAGMQGMPQKAQMESQIEL
jgi:transcriptional regulator GlxA family with amidase domain